MSQISFVYFDVGGVAIKDFSDSPKWDIMLHDMGLDQFDRAEVDQIYDSYENEVCIGQRHIDTLLPIYSQKFGISFAPGFSMLTYFVDHFTRNDSLWPVIDALHETTKIGLLTDMYPGMLDAIFAKKLLPPVKWDQIIDSTLVQLRKPMPEIYQLAKERVSLPAEQILFVDNRQKNLVAAKEAGWQTFFYDSRDYEKSSQELADFLEL